MESIDALVRQLDLDERERRLVERARDALEEGSGGDRALRMRLRNRAESCREQAARQRLGGPLSGRCGLPERQALFEALHRELEAQSAGAS